MGRVSRVHSIIVGMSSFVWLTTVAKFSTSGLTHRSTQLRRSRSSTKLSVLHSIVTLKLHWSDLLATVSPDASEGYTSANPFIRADGFLCGTRPPTYPSLWQCPRFRSQKQKSSEVHCTSVHKIFEFILDHSNTVDQWLRWPCVLCECRSSSTRCRK